MTGQQNVTADTGEMRAAATCIALSLGFLALVLGTGLIPLASFGRLISVYAQSLGALALVVGAIALFVECGLRARREGALPSPFALIREFLTERWQRDRFFSLLTPSVVCMTVLASFNAFKQIILPSAGFNFDPEFAAWDRALFLGTDPWVVIHDLIGSPAMTRFIDSFYHAWFVPMTLGITVCAFIKSSQLRTQYVLSYIFCWIVIGTLLPYLLPAAGPCYYHDFVGGPSPFAGLMHILETHQSGFLANGESGLGALANQKALLVHFNSGDLVLGGGISAMPSMHNALAVLFALGGMRLGKVLGWLMWAYAVLIWIGSIYLGWHYAIDGLAAAAIALVIWAACGLLAKRLLDTSPAAISPIPVPAE